MQAWIKRALPGFAAALVCAAASASSLTFVRADLPDTTPGADLWQYTYTFSGALAEFGGLDLIYDQGVYAELAVDAVGPELTPSVLPPFPGEPTLVTLTAVAAQPASYATSFAVSFVRLAALPDGHPYEIFDGSFNVVGGGVAVAAAVPEPASAALLLAGGLLLAARTRRR